MDYCLTIITAGLIWVPLENHSRPQPCEGFTMWSGHGAGRQVQGTVRDCAV